MTLSEPTHPGVVAATRIAGAILLAAALTGCSTVHPPGRMGRSVDPSFPESPSAPWAPPPELLAQARKAARETPPAMPADVPAEKLASIAEAGATVDLPTLIDLALRTSPQTRETWAAARSAAEEVGSRSAAYYPQLDASASLERVHQSAVGGQFTFQITDYGPSFDLSYLLFSFGGRKADVEQARQDLAAADWQHNAMIQEVVLTVTQAYYTYLGEKALLDAAQSDLDTAETNLKAAQDRHDAGVATIADVLQAKTARSQAELDLRQVQGDLQATRGALATAIGVSPDVPVEAGALPEDVPIDRLSASIQDLLGKALVERPDLAAARARMAAAREKVKKTRAEGLPTISLGGSASRVYYDIPGAEPSNNYSARLLLSYPLFTGFRNRHDLAQAQADAKAARARVDSLTQQVSLQVWTSYYDVQTAASRVASSRDLLASASESADVAAGRYKAGVGSVLDLLTAQSALARARAQEVQARASWFLTLTQLARDTGGLGSLGAAASRGEPQDLNDLIGTISDGDEPSHDPTNPNDPN